MITGRANTQREIEVYESDVIYTSVNNDITATAIYFILRRRGLYNYREEEREG
jgi:hypothetical protein